MRQGAQVTPPQFSPAGLECYYPLVFQRSNEQEKSKMRIITVAAALLIGLASASAGDRDRIDNQTTVSVAAEAYDTENMSTIRPVNIYVMSVLFDSAKSDAGTLGDVKSNTKILTIAVLYWCRKFPESTIETQVKFVYTAWTNKGAYPWWRMFQDE
jgi:hypothetical protein